MYVTFVLFFFAALLVLLIYRLCGFGHHAAVHRAPACDSDQSDQLTTQAHTCTFAVMTPRQPME
jgi:hypothetical protein